MSTEWIRQCERVKFTADDLASATWVSDQFSWWRVARVTAKSVIVASDHSLSVRIDLDDILDWRE